MAFPFLELVRTEADVDGPGGRNDRAGRAKHDLPFAVFDRELSVFVQALRYWRQRCAAGTIGQAADDTVEQGTDRGARLLKI